MSDEVVIAIVVVALLVHLVLPLACLWAGRGFAPLLACNGVVAALVLAALAPGLPRAFGDAQIMALAGFEVLVLVAALWARRSRGWPRVVSYGAFGLHLCASVAAVLFLLTFRITRLI